MARDSAAPAIPSENPHKEDWYRSLCDNPAEYDKVVDWIEKNNPASHNNHLGMSAPEFAAHVVHACIRSVLFGDAGMWSTTGMCIAVRMSKNPESDLYKKVTLAVKP